LTLTSAELRQRILTWRHEHTLSLAEAGRRLGTTRATIAKLERGP
jgi:transcriptional regulator with XRE-family HTH domain